MSEQHPDELLTDYADGMLDSSIAERVETHVRHCVECADWLETSRDLAAALSCSQQATCALLAEYAAAPEQMTAIDYEAAVTHVESCPSCRAEIELVRAALAAAREESARHRFVASLTSRRLLVAATLLLTVAVGLLGYLAPWSRGESEQLVRDETIMGSRTVEDEGTILIVGTQVRDGATLTVRAGRRVAFGSGFSIDSNASMTVATDGRNQRRNG